MNRNARGIGFYMLVGVMLILLAFSLRNSFSLRPDITYKEFQRRLEAGQVAAVDIQPNQEVPTGVLRITARDGSDASVNVLDVAEVQKLLEEYDSVAVTIEAVEKDSIFLTTILPILLMVVFFVFFMAMMNRQTGGNNARMMNFGRSRARMVTPDSKRVFFKKIPESGSQNSQRGDFGRPSRNR